MFRNARLVSVLRRTTLSKEQRAAIRDIITGTVDTDGDGIPFWRDGDETVIDVLSALKENAEELSERWDKAVSHIGEALEILEDLASIVKVLKESQNGIAGEDNGSGDSAS